MAKKYYGGNALINNSTIKNVILELSQKSFRVANMNGLSDVGYVHNKTNES